MALWTAFMQRWLDSRHDASASAWHAAVDAAATLLARARRTAAPVVAANAQAASAAATLLAQRAGAPSSHLVQALDDILARLGVGGPSSTAAAMPTLVRSRHARARLRRWFSTCFSSFRSRSNVADRQASAVCLPLRCVLVPTQVRDALVLAAAALSAWLPLSDEERPTSLICWLRARVEAANVDAGAATVAALALGQTLAGAMARHHAWPQRPSGVGGRSWRAVVLAALATAAGLDDDVSVSVPLVVSVTAAHALGFVVAAGTPQTALEDEAAIAEALGSARATTRTDVATSAVAWLDALALARDVQQHRAGAVGALQRLESAIASTTAAAQSAGPDAVPMLLGALGHQVALAVALGSPAAPTAVAAFASLEARALSLPAIKQGAVVVGHHALWGREWPQLWPAFVTDLAMVAPAPLYGSSSDSTFRTVEAYGLCVPVAGAAHHAGSRLSSAKRAPCGGACVWGAHRSAGASIVGALKGTVGDARLARGELALLGLLLLPAAKTGLGHRRTAGDTDPWVRTGMRVHSTFWKACFPGSPFRAFVVATEHHARTRGPIGCTGGRAVL